MEKYELVKDIGSGNFGVARLMRNKETKELVAMKYIERGLKIDENVAREIINHKSLRHPNIIRFKEVVLTPTHLAIVMEYAAGGELFERICNAGRFSEDEARYFFQQLICGVHYCHHMQICHRDLKSTATKLQCFRHLGKYFKKSAKALEEQIAREARFYGSLIRLQQNWKVKRHRMVASAPGHEGFYIDLFDNTLYDPTAVFRPSSISTVRIEHDSAGKLAVNLPPNLCRSLRFEFLGPHLIYNAKQDSKLKKHPKCEDFSGETKMEPVNDDDWVKETHSVLRQVHQAIFDEQVFHLVNREAFTTSLGANVTGIQENYLQLSISQGASVSISLAPSKQGNQPVDTNDSEMFDESKLEDGKREERKWGFPSQSCYEIYLQQIIHEHVFVKAKDRAVSGGRTQLSAQQPKDGQNLLSHFSMSLAHRIFANKVLAELENLVCRIPYVHLISHPTWHSRTSSWTLSMKFPQSILLAGSQTQASEILCQSHFRTRVSVTDDCISVEGEGTPNVVGLFKGKSETVCSMNSYEFDLADLPVILLQQIASQVIRWLYEEAILVGIKANRDFLCLSFELERGETLGLVAHVDPEDSKGCISWWLVIDSDENKFRKDISGDRKFLGYLSLDVLYSTLLDLVNLCSGGGLS